MRAAARPLHIIKESWSTPFQCWSLVFAESISMDVSLSRMMALHSCLTPSCRRKGLTTAAWISFWSKQYRRELIWTSSTQLIKSTVRSCPHIVNDLPQAGDTSEAIPSHVGDPTLDGEAVCFQIDRLSSRSRHSVMAQKLTSGAYQRFSIFAATRSTSRVISSFSTLPFSLASFDQYWYRVLGSPCVQRGRE